MEVNNPADAAIAHYFQEKGYETEDGKLDAGKTTHFLRLVVGIVLSVGLLISLLSFYILMLSIFLLLQKNTTQLENLLLIGYSPQRIALPYQLLTLLLNACVLVLSIALVGLLRTSYLDIIQQLFPTLATGGSGWVMATGLLLCLGVSALNWMLIRKKVASLWKHTPNRPQNP